MAKYKITVDCDNLDEAVQKIENAEIDMRDDETNSDDLKIGEYFWGSDIKIERIG